MSDLTDFFGSTGTSGTSGTSGSGGPGGGLQWVIISSDATASDGYGYLIDSTSISVTLTLPPNPQVGDSVGACDYNKSSDVNAIYINGNGENIEGSSETLQFDSVGAGVTFVYTDSVIGWKIVTEISSDLTTVNQFDFTNFVNRGDPSGYDFQVGDFTTDDTWRDLDLSSIVPSNAVAVMLYIQVYDDVAANYFMFRKNGNSNSANRALVRPQVANQYNDADLIVPCDSNQVIEYRGANVTFTYINVIVKGWFTDDTATTHEWSSFKNKIINGNFDIWQRGTSQTATGYGSDDRWRNSHSGSTKSHTQQSFSDGQTDVPDNPLYYSRTVVTTGSGASHYVIKQHRFEDSRLFSGGSATLSFYAKADSAKDIALDFTQYFGAAGSAAVQGIGVNTFSLTTDWQKFSAVIDLPSVSGKTIAAGDYMCFNLWFDAGSDYNSRTNSLGNQSGTFDIAQIQLEKGSVATNFEQRHLGQELRLCQRYYCKSFNYDTTPADGVYSQNHSGSSYANTYCRVQWVEFPVDMVGTPTITYYGTSGDWIIYYSGTYNTPSGGTATSPYINRRGFAATITDSSLTVGTSYMSKGDWVADAEI